MKVKIVNHSPFALPAYATEFSAGMDLRADLQEPIVLGSLERALVPTGLHIELPSRRSVPAAAWPRGTASRS